MRALAIILFASWAVGCGRAPVVLVEVTDRPTLPGECLEVSAQDSAASRLGAVRVPRDGGSRYVVGVSDSKRRESLFFQAFVLSGTDCARTGMGGLVRGESDRRQAEITDAGGLVTLVVRPVDLDGDGSRSVEAGGKDCNDDDSTVSPLATQACGSATDTNCDGRAACDDPQCGSTAFCARRLRFTQPGPDVVAGECTLVEVTRVNADGGELFEGDDTLRLAVSSAQGTEAVLFSTPTCTAAFDGGARIAPGTAVAWAYLRKDVVGPLTLSADWDYAPAVAPIRIVAARAEAAGLTLPPTVSAGDCAAGSLTVRDRFGNASMVDGGSVAASFFADGGALYGDGGCLQPLGAVQLFHGTREVPVYFSGQRAGLALAGATFAGTDAGVLPVRVEPAAPVRLAFPRWDPQVARFTCTPFLVRGLDRFDNPVSVPLPVDLAVDGGYLGGQLFSDPGCVQPLTGSLPLSDGGLQAAARFVGSGQGAIVASAVNVRPAQADVALSGGVVMEATGLPAELEAGACAPVIVTRRLRDGGVHQLGPTSADVRLVAGSGLAFSEQADCSQARTGALQLAFVDGQPSRTLYVRGQSAPAGTTASFQVLEANGPTTTLSTSPLPLVRRGRCALVGVTQVRCAISPPIPAGDVSRTFLVVQATGSEPGPGALATECHLDSTGGVASVVCQREDATGSVSVGWQTVSHGLPAARGGVSVTQHRLDGGPGISVPLAAPGRTFALLNYSQPGTLIGTGDAYAVSFDGGVATLVALPLGAASNFTLQLVELGGAGALVSVSEPSFGYAASTFTAIGAESLDTSRTAPLLGALVDTQAPNYACRSLFSVSFSSAVTSFAYRSVAGEPFCAGDNVIRLHLQRVQFPTGARVITGSAAMGPGSAAAVVALPSLTTPPQQDRTVVWFSGQGLGGQSHGRLTTAGFAFDAGQEDGWGAGLGLVSPVGPAWVVERGWPVGSAEFQPFFIELSP